MRQSPYQKLNTMQPNSLNQMGQNKINPQLPNYRHIPGEEDDFGGDNDSQINNQSIPN